MTTALKAQEEKVAELGGKLRSLIDQGKENGWSQELRQQFDAIDAERESVKDNIKQLKEDAKREAKHLNSEQRQIIEQQQARSASELAQVRSLQTAESNGYEARCKAVKHFIRTGKRSDGLVPTQAAQRMLAEIGAVGDNVIHMRMAPMSYEQPRTIDHLRALYAKFAGEQRAMGAGETSLGAELVPDEMMLPVEEALIYQGNLRASATVIRTSGAGPLPIPTSDDSSNIGEIIDENSAANEADVATGQVVLGTFQYSSKIVRVHNRLLLDPAQDTSGMVLRALGSRIARIQNLHFTTGAGTTVPRGLLTDATNSGTTFAAIDTVTYDELVDVQHSLNPSYDMNASWQMHNTLIGAVKKIQSSNGTLIWMPSAVPGAPDTILGKPYASNADMPVGASAKAIAYGDMSKYHVRDMLDMFVVRLVERYAEFNQTAFLLWMFSDGALVDAGTGPVVYASNPAS